MKFDLYGEVGLLKDIPEKGLKKGDLTTVVEYHPSEYKTDGYTLEIFNAVGETIAFAVVEDSDIGTLKEGEILSVREYNRSQAIQY